MAWVDSEGRPGDSPLMAAQGLQPDAVAAHRALYEAVMRDDNGLSGRDLRAIAVAVSRINASDY